MITRVCHFRKPRVASTSGQLHRDPSPVGPALGQDPSKGRVSAKGNGDPWKMSPLEGLSKQNRCILVARTVLRKAGDLV